MQASARLSSSTSAFRKVIVGVSTATTRSCYRTCRGKAHAAPLPPQEPPQKLQKRISVQERRAKIIEFAEKEDNPKLEESTNTGLLGSLKSFAYGIRNFWKNM